MSLKVLDPQDESYRALGAQYALRMIRYGLSAHDALAAHRACWFLRLLFATFNHTILPCSRHQHRLMCDIGYSYGNNACTWITSLPAISDGRRMKVVCLSDARTRMKQNPHSAHQMSGAHSDGDGGSLDLAPRILLQSLPGFFNPTLVVSPERGPCDTVLSSSNGRECGDYG